MRPQPTALAVRTFSQALDETRRLSHASVRPEHILLGLLRLTEGCAAAALDSAGTERGEVRRELEARLPSAEQAPHEGEYPYHASGAQLLQELMAEPPRGASGRITTGHVLLGLLTIGHAPIVEAMEAAGVDVVSLVDRLRSDPDGSE